MVPAAIVIHLSSEFASLGLAEFSRASLARHAYLFIAGLCAFIGASFTAGLCASPAARRGRVLELLDNLPFCGSGLRFIALCFAVQFTLFTGAQILEGDPLGRGDFTAGAVCAVLACVAAAFGMAAIPKRSGRMIFAAHLSRSFERGLNARRMTAACFFGRVFVPLCDAYQAVVGNRPPPPPLRAA